MQILLFVLLFVFASPSFGEDFRHEEPVIVEVSPNKPWSESFFYENGVEGGDSPSTMRKVLLWLPNRFLDLIDIFRIDVGVGLSKGGVIRLTEYGQMGYREMSPASIRAGLLGRRWPVMLEEEKEYGFGPSFKNSTQRVGCTGQIGLGVDLFVAGVHSAICVDELVDFAAGLFLIDFMDDDLD